MLFADFQFMPDQASTLAPRVDGLFFFISGVTIFFSLLIAILVIVFAVRYRRRSPNEVPEQLKENAGATFYHASTDERLHLIYCPSQDKGMWFLPGSGMGPLQERGRKMMKEIVEKA